MLGSYIHELNSIHSELQLLSSKKKELGDRSKLLKKQIIEILKKENQPGVKYNGGAIILKTKDKYQRKTKKEYTHDSINILSNCGVQNPQQVLEELKNVKHGQVNQETILQMVSNQKKEKKRKYK